MTIFKIYMDEFENVSSTFFKYKSTLTKCEFVGFLLKYWTTTDQIIDIWTDFMVTN